MRPRPPLLALAVVAGLAPVANAQRTVILVRHAEKADGSSDPGLSAAGKARAEALAALLRDAEVDAIYTSPFRRTKDTAAPLAAKRGIVPKADPQDDAAALAKAIREGHADGRVLVVGHSNTIPALLKALGHAPAAPVTIADDEFDHLFVVVPAATGPPSVTHLRYGK